MPTKITISQQLDEFSEESGVQRTMLGCVPKADDSVFMDDLKGLPLMSCKTHFGPKCDQGMTTSSAEEKVIVSSDQDINRNKEKVMRIIGLNFFYQVLYCCGNDIWLKLIKSSEFLHLSQAAFVPGSEITLDTSIFTSQYSWNTSEDCAYSPSEFDDSSDSGSLSGSSSCQSNRQDEQGDECGGLAEFESSSSVNYSFSNFLFMNLSQLASIIYDLLSKGWKDDPQQTMVLNYPMFSAEKRK
ncbi:probable serine/threonine protein kinase IREH1 [Telopea speciosissima]|uniref:probable serine/threonine protein kinase IREH1 n=1 Tax=Telopea speciosissima TaxID=54955 RepID=UPI001CC51833|nr:probable serine/threonine protein kinase IREH1 [Telopea speciosissima]